MRKDCERVQCFRVMMILYILIVVMAIWVSKFVKTQRTEYIKCVQFNFNNVGLKIFIILNTKELLRQT